MLPDLRHREQVSNQPNYLHQGLNIGLLLHSPIIPGSHTHAHLLHLALALQLTFRIVLEARVDIVPSLEVEVELSSYVGKEGSHVSELGIDYAKM